MTERFLGLADEALPGLVEGLYLHGSLGFGEWYDGRSDVDYVAVLAERPDADTLATLAKVHAEMGTAPPFDGTHVTWADLEADPTTLPHVPSTLAGEFRTEGRCDPVTWHELAWHGVHVRGPALADLQIWTDLQGLRRYTHGNLGSYWAGRLGQLREHPTEAARPDLVLWFVLGPARLHHLLATDRLTSKDGGGRHVVQAFGEGWRPLVNEALAYRATGALAGVLAPEQLSAQVIELTDLVVREGLAIWP